MAHSLTFPSSFVWGAATASYQIEGAARTDGRLPSVWDTFSHTPGTTFSGDTGDVACDHYHHWRDDIAIMHDLGLKAYRFSVAWPRIIPDGHGAVNQQGLDFYDHLIDGLLAADIVPYITLFHWDLPQTLQDRGGWANRATVDAFIYYTDVVTKRFGDRVKHWMTLNEPSVHGYHGHFYGVHAPGLRDLDTTVKAIHHQLLAHGRAVPIIRANSAGAAVGIALNLITAEEAEPTEESQQATWRHDGQWNRMFLDPLFRGHYPTDMVDLLRESKAEFPIVEGDLAAINAPLDFLGVNYYTRCRITNAPENLPFKTQEVAPLPPTPVTSMGWEVHPEGLSKLLQRLHHDYAVNAYYIMENGAAFDDQVEPSGAVIDTARQEYLRDHFAAVERAMHAGVPVKGFFVWSLLDNFEWAEGYRRRFGLVFVDFTTQQRTIKQSGHWYRSVIQPSVPTR